MIIQLPTQRQDKELSPEEQARQLMLSKNITLDEAKKIIESKQKSIGDF
ncbi:hypothetical protein ACFLZ7_03385 [Nanoarchaeota archaeon]